MLIITDTVYWMKLFRTFWKWRQRR